MFSEEYLQNNTQCMKFYTGKLLLAVRHRFPQQLLPLHSIFSVFTYMYIGIEEWSVLKALYDIVKKDITDGVKLSKFEMFMIFFSSR